MTVRRVAIEGPLALVYSARVLTDLPELSAFVAELNQLGRQGNLPVTLETTKDGWRMALHCRRHVAWLYPAWQGDGRRFEPDRSRPRDSYRLGHAGRRQFRDEDRLLKGALVLRCDRGFALFPNFRALQDAIRTGQLPQTRAYDDVLQWEWHQLGGATAQPPSRPTQHTRYLDLLESVVEASRQIESEQQSAMPPQHYVTREPAKEERWSARGVYRFRVHGEPVLTTNTMVSVDGYPQARGRVFRVHDGHVTVRFEPGTDYGRIPATGSLRALVSDRVFRAQLDAITTLRQGRALNAGLLDCLVSARFAPYQPTAAQRPGRDLDADQLQAFRRALEVPDLLSVLGPPGAGKTTTIVEVVRAQAELGRRVLITSHSHRAVDNVLEKLPAEFTVVRVGNEDNMTAKVKAMSAESRVDELRGGILRDTALFDLLSKVHGERPVLEEYLRHLETTLAAARTAQAELDGVGPALAEAVRLAGGPIGAQLAAAEGAQARHQSTLAAQHAAWQRAQQRLQSAQLRAGTGGVFAFVHAWWASRQRGRLDRLAGEIPATQAALAAATAAVSEAHERAAALVAHDPRVAELTARRDAAERALDDLWPELARDGELLRQALRPVLPAPAEPGRTVAGWTGFAQWCAAGLDLVSRRAQLLGEWRDRISDLSVQLEREVARYADVVGATCIGTDTSALIAGLEFELAIVDEAGQISTPNLLVPLVRAKRAMLVGDHRQLPPFLDEEVRDWAERQPDGADPGQVGEVTGLLAKSGFELLFARTPESNAVWLRTQRRMPAQIADFVSSTFYFGRLRTEHPGAPPNTLFRSPFAMIDTSDRQPTETDMSRSRGATRRGYSNKLEADIIVALLHELAGQYRDWAIIVPYNAQKELLLSRLPTVLDGCRVADHVGSVDSFQGGERDLIIFGFTRSNRAGRIGFLRETRRFNVAITRAKRQLVLVGDLSTLCNADDLEFRAISQAMAEHLRTAGHLRSSRDLEAALRPGTGWAR
ncbi:ATP-binding protein [Actinoplanes sp. KI2]|uniref:DEAD/DEAH box helicase n=1 Tax=Actinoplanes sp. KI2 TaxID=2983315 RepID=UPI0021D58D0F|nr:ATP-binding protein [Actinoplanes sp. KI2]MCU7731069.1 ATP-binding protein [Actinoplanes sp. KI2]